MVPRSQMSSSNAMSRRTNWWRWWSNRATHVPVIGEDRDQILGILLAKDLLRLQTAGDSRSRYANTAPVVFVPESKPAQRLLRSFG